MVVRGQRKDAVGPWSRLVPSARLGEGAIRVAAKEQAQAHDGAPGPIRGCRVTQVVHPQVGGNCEAARGRRARGRQEAGGTVGTEVVACGSPGLATDEGADSGRVSGAWGDGRRAAELRG